MAKPALAFARFSNKPFRKTEISVTLLLVKDPRQSVNAAAKSRGARAAIRSLQWLFLAWGAPGRSFMPWESAQAVENARSGQGSPRKYKANILPAWDPFRSRFAWLG
jgi:hypothetical protein